MERISLLSKLYLHLNKFPNPGICKRLRMCDKIVKNLVKSEYNLNYKNDNIGLFMELIRRDQY